MTKNKKHPAFVGPDPSTVEAEDVVALSPATEAVGLAPEAPVEVATDDSSPAVHWAEEAGISATERQLRLRFIPYAIEGDELHIKGESAFRSPVSIEWPSLAVELSKRNML
jgi:hypothetical protein